ncbi:hypothetical protein CDAR_513891, partial [Caerostris darwini]
MAYKPVVIARLSKRHMQPTFLYTRSNNNRMHYRPINVCKCEHPKDTDLIKQSDGISLSFTFIVGRTIHAFFFGNRKESDSLDGEE